MMSFIIDDIMSRFSCDVGIDLGTSNTPVIVKNRGIKLREPSYIAFDKRKNKVIAVGHEAKFMYGKEPDFIKVIRPMKDGIINNFEAVQEMITYYLNKIRMKNLFKPRVIIGVPTEATPVERKAVLEAGRLAGARSVYIIQQTLAAAMGAGLPVDKPRGNMILDIGGGTSEAAVISMGSVVVSRSINIAGDEMDEAIQEYCKKKYNLLIGERTAEEIKIFLGQAEPSDAEKTMKIRGRGLIAKLPQVMEITNNEVAFALKDVITALGNLLKSVFEETPPELSVDIIENGIVMTGGASQITGLDAYLEKVTGIRCYLAPDPVFAVTYGLNKVFNNLNLLRRVGTYRVTGLGL